MNKALFELSKRRRKGQQQAEFAAAFTVLIVVILIPLINLAAVPMRLGLAQAVVKDTVKSLARSEKFSEAVKYLNDGTMSGRLTGLGGVEAKQIDLTLRLTKVTQTDQSISVSKPGSIPKSWLPDGANNTSIQVQLVLKVQADISPMLLMSGIPAKIPGLTIPFSTNLEEYAAWENLGRDPNSGEFFLNE